MPVQIHELVIRAALAERGEAKAAGPSERELLTLREDILRECLKHVQKLVENERRAR